VERESDLFHLLNWMISEFIVIGLDLNTTGYGIE